MEEKARLKSCQASLEKVCVVQTAFEFSSRVRVSRVR